ncbi:MAG: Gfo/Idh/MocA family oxidoreductase [Prevotellaceae bacterium]|jgi:predicted dehydrogenase|nr:Gfo/Idh/MocA family oxidoreductase [Prevotellaceae bacterium]
MRRTIRIGFIGAGDIANLHARAIAKLPGAELRGLWNRTASRAKAKAAEYGCRAYETAEELLVDPKIEAVFILTNVETHFRYAVAAAEAGKHILMEKPVAETLEELLNLKKVIERTKVKLMPVHNYIHEPGVERIREMIQSGALGAITQFHMMYNIFHPEDNRVKYPGVIHQIMTHHAYTMIYLAGLPAAVSCMKSNIDATFAKQENVAMAVMKMQNNALSHLSASFAGDDHAGEPWTCMIKVIGTKGSAKYSYRDWVVNAPNGPHSQTYFCYPESIVNTASSFIENVLRNGREPLSTLDDAIAVQRIIDACEKSAEEGITVNMNFDRR